MRNLWKKLILPTLLEPKESPFIITGKVYEINSNSGSYVDTKLRSVILKN